MKIKNLLCFGLVLGLMTAYAFNALANISIFPYRIDFENSSRKRVQTVRVINNSDKEQTYRVTMVNYVQKPDGSLEEVNTDDKFFARNHLTWSPRQFHLKPREMQTVNIARKSLANLPDGEYVSHLKVQEVLLGDPNRKKNTNDKTISMTLTPLFAITIPVTIEKGDNLVSKTEVVSYKKLGAKQVEFVLKRLGNKSSRVNLVIEDANGEVIGRLNEVKVYMTTNQLTMKMGTDKDLPGKAVLKVEDAKTKKIVLTKDLQF